MKAHRSVPRILLVDSHKKPRETRASVFRSRQVEVDSVASLGEARVLWASDTYGLILLTPREMPQELIEFFDMVKQEDPTQRIAFLVGSPEYISFVIPEGMVPA